MRKNQYNCYANAALLLSILSILGSLLSLVNAIPLIITYQLLKEAESVHLEEKKVKVISHIFEFALLLTLTTTIFYSTIQF